jgi:CheY-like chemotaxis protein
MRRGNGVLVVDNEPGIRRLLDFAMSQLGYNVWQAANGEQAIKLFRQNSDDIGLIIMDVVMPVLDGIKALECIRGIDPSLPCCFMTGHSGEYELSDLQVFEPIRVFVKPFVLSEMMDTARRLLKPATIESV